MRTAARPRRAVGVTLAGLVSAVALGASGVALAVGPADVKDLIRRGNDLRRSGRDQAAVPLFQQAYEIERSPRTAGQLGLSGMALGYWLVAEQHLAEALSAPRHPWVARNREALAGALQRAQSNIAEVEIVGAPAGADVLVNGKSVGKLPLPLPFAWAKEHSRWS